MRDIILILLLFFCFNASAQQSEDEIDFENFQEEFLGKLIHQKINWCREKEKIKSLDKSEKLQLAAKDQADYILKTGALGSIQSSKKKETPASRVYLYGGMNGVVEENYQVVSFAQKVKVPGKKKRVALKSYNDLVEVVVGKWMNSRSVDSKQNILSENFYQVGTGITYSKDDKRVYVTQVFGSEPFLLPDGVEPIKDAYRINPYNPSECSELEKEYSYLAELMSDNIFLKNNQIYFYFHDLALFKNVMKSSKDAIAVDIVLRDQYSCETGNKRYPSPLHKGILLPPVKASQLFGRNELEESNELQVSLGPIPEYVDTNTTEFNLLIIKNNCLCQTIIYNNIGGKNLHSLGLEFSLDTLSPNQTTDSIIRQLKFTIPFEKNKADYTIEDIKPFLDSLNLNRFNLKKIDITAYSSIEGNEEANKKLQEKRAKSILTAIENYNIQKVETSVKTEENWDGFYESIAGSPYEAGLRRMTKEELRKLANTSTKDYNLEPYLEDQRKAEIALTVERIFVDYKDLSDLPKKVKKAIENKDYFRAKALQSVLFKDVKSGKTERSEILKIEIPNLKETSSLINNQLAFNWMFTSTNNKDSLNKHLTKELEKQLAIQPTNPYLQYNKQVLQLFSWSSKLNRVAEPKVLLKKIRALQNTKIELWKVNQLVFNYHLISADFYYENQRFVEREKALKEVKKRLLSSTLGEKEMYKIAKYFMFQMKLDWAIEVMKPWVEKKDVKEDFLFTFLTIAIYDRKEVTEEEYLKFMEKAKTINEQRFCKMFGFPNMSFQLLEDLAVKKMYCNTCNE